MSMCVYSGSVILRASFCKVYLGRVRRGTFYDEDAVRNGRVVVSGNVRLL